MSSANYHLLRILTNAGQRHLGVRDGPTTVAKLLRADFKTTFETEIEKGTYAKVMDQVKQHRLKHKGGKEIILGGDHSTSIVTLPATKAKYEGAKVVWLDAHADINTPAESLSGNLHGMPLAAALGLFHPEGIQACLGFEDLIYVGIRDVDNFEWDVIKRNKIPYYTADDVLNDVKGVCHELRSFCGSSPLHISFDVDIADPSLAIGTGTRVEKGLHRPHIDAIFETLGECRWKVLESVEVNPALDQSNQTSELVAQIINAFMEKDYATEKSSEAMAGSG